MESEISKAQLEVWEWKDKAGEELSKIPKGKRMAYIKKKTAPLIAKLKMKKAKRDLVIA